MRTSATLLFHPLFVLSLIALICNDFCWKYQYPNWFTGKLSDVAGLVVLPLFGMAFFQNKKSGSASLQHYFFAGGNRPFQKHSFFSLPKHFLSLPAAWWITPICLPCRHYSLPAL